MLLTPVLLTFFFVVQGGEYFASLPGGTGNCGYPHYRQSWSSLTTAQKQNYINCLTKMKNLIVTVNSAGLTCSLYDLFTEMHNENSCQWHSSSYFFPVHRYLMYKFECAVQYIASAYGLTFKPPISPQEACNITVPYWDWGVDANRMKESSMFGTMR